MEERICWTDK